MPGSEQSRLHFCPNCGAKLPDTIGRFCGVCGTELRPYVSAYGAPAQQAAAIEAVPVEDPVGEQSIFTRAMTLDFGPLWRPLAFVLVAAGVACPVFQFADVTYWMLFIAVVAQLVMVHYERVVARSDKSNSWLFSQASGDSCISWFFVFLVIGSTGAFGLICKVLLIALACYRYLSAFGEKPSWVPGQFLVLAYLGALAAVFVVGLTSSSAFLFWLLLGAVFIIRGVWAYLESTPPGLRSSNG